MAAEYRLLTYRAGKGKPAAGVLIGERIYPAADLAGAGVDASSVLALLQVWDKVHPRFKKAAAKADPKRGIPLAKAEVLPPLLYPTAIFCAGANYWDHLEEMARAGAAGPKLTGDYVRPPRPAEPWFFVKTSAHSVVGPNETVRLPPFSKKVDWEAEIGVVIGRAKRDLPVERAFEAVAGYTIVNDHHAPRDVMSRAKRTNDCQHDAENRYNPTSRLNSSSLSTVTPSFFALSSLLPASSPATR
jgi:2-keto-4-pentenoate hydratase/2-oxohepta-3-ene-1,7-dioic acid hydratase in catechol pathway